MSIYSVINQVMKILMNMMVMLKFLMIILAMKTKYVLVMDMMWSSSAATMANPDEIVIEETFVMALTRKTRVINGRVTTTELTLTTDYYRN